MTYSSFMASDTLLHFKKEKIGGVIRKKEEYGVRRASQKKYSESVAMCPAKSSPSPSSSKE